MEPARLRAASVVAALAAAVALGAGCADAPPPRPSFLLVTTSALPTASLACYGAPGGAGGAICGLGDRGARFVWAFTPSPATAPAAASLLTSQRPSEHGVHASAATFLRSGATTLASVLAREGYATAAFVAVPDVNRSRNLQQGFEVYDAPPPAGAASAAARAADAAYAWLGDRERARPFLVWVHFPSASAAGATAPPLYGLGLDDLDGYVRMLVARAQETAGEAGVGIAFAALAGADLASDGGAGGDVAPLALERVHVPLLWTPPGGVVPQVARAPVPLLDLAPTIVAAAGFSPPESFEGEGLRVGPLPPTAPRPARPLLLEDDREIGVVLSRRYYARARDGVVARTALLPDEGPPPRSSAISPNAEEVAEHEDLLRSASASAPLWRNGHSAGGERAFPPAASGTASR